MDRILLFQNLLGTWYIRKRNGKANEKEPNKKSEDHFIRFFVVVVAYRLNFSFAVTKFTLLHKYKKKVFRKGERIPFASQSQQI